MGYRGNLDGKLLYDAKKEEYYVEESYFIDVLDDIELELNDIRNKLEGANEEDLKDLKECVNESFLLVDFLLKRLY